jgi:hypothetical protein
MAYTMLNACVRIKSSTNVARNKKHGCSSRKLTTMLVSMAVLFYGLHQAYYRRTHQKLHTCSLQ